MEKWKDVPDNDIEICSPENRFHKDDKWALKKKGNKRASKICNSEEEAKNLLQDGQEIEFRPGEDTKCLYYCDCKNHCNHYKKFVK